MESRKAPEQYGRLPFRETLVTSLRQSLFHAFAVLFVSSLIGCSTGNDSSRPTTAPPTATRESPAAADLVGSPLAVAPAGLLSTLEGQSATPQSGPTGLTSDCFPGADEEGFYLFADFRSALRCVSRLFTWPAAYVPDTDAAASLFPDAEESRFQQGYEYTMLSTQNICAWQMTWLDAVRSGDGDLANEALTYLTETVPDFASIPGAPPYVMSQEGVEFYRSVHEKAALGDVAFMQAYVTQNCQGIAWLATTPAATPAAAAATSYAAHRHTGGATA